jgi:hypothetical protein
MANPVDLAKLKGGVEAYNQWRGEYPRFATFVGRGGADLGDANLRRANLRDANLWHADLRGADLREVDLSWANLLRADLSGAKLHGANLRAANLRGVNLADADLLRADLIEADLSGAKLNRTDLNVAKVRSTIFINVDLSETRGLEEVEHFGPSGIGIDTIYKSKGKIPPVFLRGAGVPENFITYMASLVGAGIEFYSLFISYSTKDQAFADRLHADLQAKAVRCWFAPHDIRGGRKIHEQIDEAIRVYDKLLLILSPSSMTSDWVKWEIANARTREISEGKRVLFPIRLCPYETLNDWKCPGTHPGSDLAPEIREYFIPDFSNWKDHDSYRLAFDRLLKDLQGKPESPSI